MPENIPAKKTFKCDIFTRQFVHRGNLELHTRTHTGEKPYILAVCNSHFLDNYGHIKRTHTNKTLQMIHLYDRLYIVYYITRGTLKVRVRALTV